MIEITNTYCYVSGGKVVTPVNVYSASSPILYNPFPRPVRVGDKIISENTTHEDLAKLNIFRVLVDNDIPENAIITGREHIVQEDQFYVLDHPIYRILSDQELEEERIVGLKQNIINEVTELLPEIGLRYLGLSGLMEDTEFENRKVSLKNAFKELRGN